MARFLITGANRGIGLELARQLAMRGERVFAACRQPDRAADLQALAAAHPGGLTVVPLDVLDDDSIARAVETVAGEAGALDGLVNNAAILLDDDTVDRADRSRLRQTFETNALAPLVVARQFKPLLRKGQNPRLVNISSEMGSIGSRTGPGDYIYSASKAALNMLTRLLSFEWRRDGITAIVLDPGWVQTDMGGSDADLTSQESVRGILQVIDGLTLKDSGRYLRWNGEELPW